MRVLLFLGLLVLQPLASAQGSNTVFGLQCNEPLESVAKRVKLSDLTEKDIDEFKLLRHPDFVNQLAFDSGFTKVAFALPDPTVNIAAASLRFSHNALADVSLQFAQQNDDARFSQGAARARDLAFTLAAKYNLLPTPQHKSEGFNSLSTYTDWNITLPNAKVLIGTRPVTVDGTRQHFRSALLARVQYSEGCGPGRRLKAVS